jgi:hypothetical protein
MTQRKQRTKARFSPEDDAKLIELVNKFGCGEWKRIASFFENRNERQVHDRWVQYLAPSNSNNLWSEEEDALLLLKVNEIGKKWVKLTSFFQGRSDAALKTRFQKIVKKTKHKETEDLFITENNEFESCEIDFDFMNFFI